MAIVVDLRNKLGLGERPRIIVADGVELEVDDSAPTVLQVIDALRGEMTNERMLGIFDLFFGEDARKKMDELGTSIPAYTAIVEAAIGTVMGEGDSSPKEMQTPDTTS